MGVFAALIAAWVLETTEVSTEYLPLLSVIRTVNNGPQSHIRNVLHSFRTGSRKFYSFVIILAILDALALQFTSTLLIADFDVGVIVLHTVNNSIPYGILSEYDDDPKGGSGMARAVVSSSFVKSLPPTYPRFAELSEPNSSYIGMDYVDTGETLRAFLPLELPDDRANIREYKGPATVVDTRVRCARPSLSITNITLVYEASTNSPYEIVVLGGITMEATVPGITVNETDDLRSGLFVSTAMAKIQAETTDWRLSYGLVELGNLLTQGGQNELWMNEASLYSILLINITGNDWTHVLESIDLTTGTVGPYNWTQKPPGIWSDLRTTNETIDIGMSATVCFVSRTSNDLWVHANSEHDFTEPRSMPWDRDSRSYRSEEVRQMLGVTNEQMSLEKRGILRLRQPANWTETIISADSEQYISESIFKNMDELLNPEIIKLYPNDTSGPIHRHSAILTPYSKDNSVHRAHCALFQDIIQSTGNLALAVQAMLTVFSQMVYYDVLPMFFLRESGTIAKSKQVNVPVHWKGFGVVMALLILHTILIVTAIILFLSESNHSLLGNAWQTIAQVSSSDTKDVMHHVLNMADKEIEHLLRTNGYENNEMVLKTSVDSGRSQVSRRR